MREEEVDSVTQETVHRSPNSVSTPISSEDDIIMSTLQGVSPSDETTNLPTGASSTSTSTGEILILGMSPSSVQCTHAAVINYGLCLWSA